MIAKHFDIKNTTVSDLIASLEKNKVLKVKKLGGSKIVLLK
jgi:Mn-dependent DtxR family transcriptional regulator